MKNDSQVCLLLDLKQWPRPKKQKSYEKEDIAHVPPEIKETISTSKHLTTGRTKTMNFDWNLLISLSSAPVSVLPSSNECKQYQQWYPQNDPIILTNATRQDTDTITKSHYSYLVENKLNVTPITVISYTS